MTKCLSFMLVSVICFFAYGCNTQRTSESLIEFKHEVLPKPHVVGDAIIRIVLADKAGKPVIGARLKLEGNMSHPGMAPVFSEATEKGNGWYEAKLRFTMGGDWIVLTDITLSDGKHLERKFSVNGVRPE